jgi:hypothetical protein
MNNGRQTTRRSPLQATGKGHSMAKMDFGKLRTWLDDHAQYAGSFRLSDPGFGIAQKMLGIISDARNSLRPSADSTANYVPNKEILEALATLRTQAEEARGNRH